MMALSADVKNIQAVILLAIVFTISLGEADGFSGRTRLQDVRGTIKSPWFPGKYPNNYQNVWEIRVSPDLQIELVFDSFNLEQCSNCDCDYVAIYDGNISSSSFVGKYCGTDMPSTMLLLTNVVHIQMKTDPATASSGFSARYTTRLTPLQDVRGNITSPWFPGNYPHNYQKVWEIRVSPELQIELVFDSFNLELCSNCDCDYVAIYDGNISSSSLLGKYCGTDMPSTMLLLTNVVHIEMKTDPATALSGFSARYTTTRLHSDFYIDINVAEKTERNLTQQILNTRRIQTSSVNKWGKDITKTAVALFLEDPLLFASGKEIGEEIAYDLALQLMSKLVLKKRISTKDLALFVNAMTVACINPKTFFGVNVLAELRRRIDNSNEINPFFLLALCIGGENMTMDDVHKLQLPIPNHLRSSWTEIQAMAVMALKCISKQSHINVDTTLTEMILELKRKQQSNGTNDNMKTTALVIQAFIATENFRTDFNVSMALETIVEDMKHARIGTEEIYYILPILNWRTLLDISSNHCETFIVTDLPQMVRNLHEHSDKQVQVQISIIIGDDMDFTRTWRIKVLSNCSFYDALKNISFSEPNFKFQYILYDEKPYVAGLNDFQNSVVDDSFWFIYTKPLSSDEDPVFIKQSPIEIQVKETEELILWYRSGFSEITL